MPHRSRQSATLLDMAILAQLRPDLREEVSVRMQHLSRTRYPPGYAAPE